MKTFHRLTILTALLAYLFGNPIHGQKNFGQPNDYFNNRMTKNAHNFWLITSKGVALYDLASGECVLPDFKYDKEVKSYPTAVQLDKDNNLWIGTEEDGVLSYDGDSLRHHRVPIHYLRCVTRLGHCYALATDSEGSVWAGGVVMFANYSKQQHYCLRGTIQMYPPAGDLSVTDIAFDSKGKLWVSYNSSDCNLHYLEDFDGDYATGIRINEHDREDSTVAYSVAVDKKDNIWRTCNDGIYYFDQEKKKDYLYDFEDYPALPKAFYTDCLVDEQGDAWFLSESYLVRYTGEDFTSYTHEDLRDARSLLLDEDKIWVLTKNDDLLCFRNEEFTSTHLDPKVDIDLTKKTVSTCTARIENNVLHLTSTADCPAEVRICTANGTLLCAVSADIKMGENTIPLLKAHSSSFYIVEVRHADGITETMKVLAD